MKKVALLLMIILIPFISLAYSKGDVNGDKKGNLYANTKGSTTLKYYRDGVFGSVTISIKD